MIELKHVMQEDSHGCVIACIAIITGRSYQEIKKDFPDFEDNSKGIGADERDLVLVRHQMLPVRTVDTHLYADKVYLVSVPSLNIEATMHAIVIDCRTDVSFKVYDPQAGIEGKKAYTSDSMLSWADVTEIKDARRSN